MTDLELLAPAKNIEIGIAAIDCGADAVYIAGPAFGARQAAGNSMDDLAALCRYAHKFGARVFMTLNTILFDDELNEAYSLMCQAEDAGIDAIIVQDLSVMRMADGGPDGNGRRIGIPLHASTQCAIRDSEKALFYKQLGFSRLVLERELSLQDIRKIREATGCEIEFFIHGALCVCYSGQCYMSECISGRSANRGECIQACRSLYNLVDSSTGKVLVRNKALLSLKDYNLLDRVEDLAEAGVSSFKIEGRLKNISYVRNTVTAYSRALDKLVVSHPDRYRRSSFSRIRGGLTPDLAKTFNRGYTELFIDGHRGMWSSMDTPKGMGEIAGVVKSIVPCGKNEVIITLKPNSSAGSAPASKNSHNNSETASAVSLSNGDGFAFTSGNGEIIGFRGDVCSGQTIRCKKVAGLSVGTLLYRNISATFEKTLAATNSERLIDVNVNVSLSGCTNSVYILTAEALTEDGRKARISVNAGNESAGNVERMKSIISSQLSKTCGDFSFHANTFPDTEFLTIGTEDGSIPFMSAAFLNDIRRRLSDEFGKEPAHSREMLNLRNIQSPDNDNPQILNKFPSQQSLSRERSQFPPRHLSYKFNIANKLAKEAYLSHGADSADSAYEIVHNEDAELMRTRYCIRYELGQCHKMKPKGTPFPARLHLENNGQVFPLQFDCSNCEMVVKMK